ncbi:putative oxalocrotonate tautomerase enzyme [Teratosphaeria destructans]|uniref:Oxalocrotonate tautomerase enzyme n=1 Tax=Teratosphaeria destructans TaxID=418781 RepID=A0A9W7SWA2_9PEZI|nr:putative oxalocrotonate tautomerase enzyme [Teratosphaeria destructans]
MPLYEVQHTIPLTASQQDDLAVAITDIHSTKFTTPKMFVNVSYHDISKTVSYIGGKRRTGNHIRAHVRVGPSRTQEDWDDLSLQVTKAWDRIIGVGLPKVKRAALDPDTSLRSFIILGGLVGGVEAGFVLPPAGGDVKWLKENWDAFNKKAEEGDEDFVEMVREVKERGLMDGANGFDIQSAQKRLDEELGWGESA